MTLRFAALLALCCYRCGALSASEEAHPAAATPAEEAQPATAPAAHAEPAAPAPTSTEAKASKEDSAKADAVLDPAAKEALKEATRPPAPAVEAPPPVAETVLSEHGSTAHVQKSHYATPEEVASLLRIANSKRDRGDYVSAEMAYLQVLAEKASTEQDRDALLGLARTYRKKGDFTKASAVYERFLKAFPGDAELPSVYLELGRTLRALGAHKQAIGRFYSVLNSTLKLPDQGEELYRQLARTAQFEIAETYFQIGDYAQATRFFSRLKLLDLAPEDRARAHFKSVYALTLAGEDEKAIAGLRSFLDQNPEDENVPEARYLLSIALRRQGRTQESVMATLDLLKVESGRSKSDNRRWAYWQRKTGNQLANEFYQSGDFTSALLIYQRLALLSPDPAWNLPVTYQIGLCYERLRQFGRARECYQSIVEGLKKSATEGQRRPELSDLAEMATWRLSQLDWQNSTETQISAIFTNGGSHPPASTTPKTPPQGQDHASASDHDTHGSASIASNTLR